MRKVKILNEFRDKVDHETIYRPGQVVETFDNERAESLIARGLAEEIIEPVETIFGSIDIEKSIKDIEDAVKTVADIELLEAALSAEQKLRNRVGVQSMLNDRIEELKAAEEHELSGIAVSKDVAALKEMLTAENASAKPRQSFVSAITDRIIELI